MIQGFETPLLTGSQELNSTRQEVLKDQRSTENLGKKRNAREQKHNNKGNYSKKIRYPGVTRETIVGLR